MEEDGVGEVCTNSHGKFASSKSLDVQYNKLFKNLKILLATKEDTEMVVRRNSQKDATNAYKLWTNMVSEAAEEVQKLIDKYEEVKRLRWWHVKRRSRLSEEMEKKCNHVCELLNDECLREFLVDKPPEPVLKELNVPQISGYPTLQNALENILSLLKNSKIKVIGVCGTKGVGKTTMLRNLNNNEEVAKLFDMVIFVKATTDDQLQEKIANRLMLDIENIKGHSVEVARRIHKELENKKYLLILDEVEIAINLDQLGIPSDRNGSKVVIASQLPQVYGRSLMEKVITVELSNEEAWKMFRDTVRAMDPSWSRLRDSLKEGTSSAKYEVSYQEELLSLMRKYEVSYQEELLSLMRIRDFISLLLSYPVKLEEEGILYNWINAFPKWKSQLLSTNDHTVIDKPWRVLTEKAFTRMEGLVPMGEKSQIERGEGSIFNYNNDEIPEAILNLSIDLAVEQLIQALCSRDDVYAHNIHHVRLTTRNLVEKRTVVNKIVAALKDSHNKFGIDKDFLRAHWIDSSKFEGDVEVRIQEEINMVMAGVVTEDDDLLRIKEEMANNRYLVIVDGDKKVDPGKVCFPAGVVVLITTEPSSKSQAEDFTNTCTIDLNIRTQDHLLPWEVFCSYVGISMVFSSRAIQRSAVKIVEECRGHLLAIVLVAKSLKNVEDVKLWELALTKLSYINPSFDYQESDRIGNSGVMVNAFVNIIWEGINKTQRYCLEVSLFVNKIKKGVPDKILTSNWVSALSMSTQERPQRSYELLKSVLAEIAADNIRELLDRSVLLQRESETENVYLPIETYDIIKSLHTLNPSILRLGELGLTEPPYIGRWHGLIRIELMDNKISELPESPICPNLKVLLLQGNAVLIDIPDSFFDCMPLLQYLDLSYTSITYLPASISKLIRLEVFYLRGCDLFMELPPNIGQLKRLLDLDLDGTSITHLPEEIKELINLQRLVLCFDGYRNLLGHDQISSSTIIPPGVISNLTRLKYLSINVDPEDDRWNENVVNILGEISGLRSLETVSTHVPEAKLLELLPPACKHLNFRLVVGNYMRRFISRVTPEVEQKFKSCECSIKFVNGVDVPNQVKRNLGRFKALYLDRHMTMKSLADFELMNLQYLQECILAECNEMETIVDGSYSHDGTALPCLESLTVFYMKNLRSICERPLQFHTSVFLCSLKSMALHTCPMLTTIFSTSFLENLSLLEELIVEDCPKVTTLISHDSFEHETNIFLPRLRKIWLLYLPELINIFNGLHVGQSLQEMGFYYCPKLHSLSKTELSSEGLRVIKGESRWWETLKWNEAEWGDAGRPNFLNLIFSPINVETDIMAQLVADHDVDEDQVQTHTPTLSTFTYDVHPPKYLDPTLPFSAYDPLQPDPFLLPQTKSQTPTHYSPEPHAPGRACPQTTAALKIQKVYQGYRTRRSLADCAIVVEDLWSKAIDFVNFPETAASRWTRVKSNASKVGKGLSLDTKAQILATQHWLEAIDPRHRYGHNLHYYYEEWFKTDTTQPFFYWLDIGNGKNLDLEQCPRSKLQRQCMKYLGPQEREHYEYIVCDGKIIHKQSGDFLHTTEDSKDAKWIFVMSTSEKLYAGKKKKGQFHHSSFLAGGATLVAGRLEAQHGILKFISAYSRHYRTTEHSLNTFLSYLKENGVNLDEVELPNTRDDIDTYDLRGRELGERAITSEDSSNANISYPEISEESENTPSSNKEDPQPGSVGSYRRTLSGGLQNPIAEVSKTAKLQRFSSEKATKSYRLEDQLSRKWSTGAGPRIRCVADYPVEFRRKALEKLNLPPKLPPLHIC